MVKMVTVFAVLLSLAFAKTYPIAEPDLLEEIQERLEKIDFESVRQKLKEKVKNLRPYFLAYLPPAQKSYKYEVDLTYTLEYDIPRVNERGEIVGVLYPKGYTFNPIKYLKVTPPVLIIFNPLSEEEIEFVKKIKKNYPRRMLLIVDGNYTKAMEKVGEPVYYLHKRIVERLKLKNTVSIVRWDKDNGVAIVEVFSHAEIKNILSNRNNNTDNAGSSEASIRGQGR